MEKIVLQEFTNRIAMEMGLRVINLAQSKELIVGVSVNRINHTVFEFLDNGLPADKHSWIRRKSNVALHFEESSLSVKESIEAKGRTLDGFFGLPEQDYVAKGGAVPIFVEGAGMVGCIIVTGLADVDDHNLIVEAMNGFV